MLELADIFREYGHAYCQQYGCRFISAMPTNAYGYGDYFHAQDSHVLPALIRRFHEAKVSGARTVTCWGTGSARREFLFVDDLADALVFMMDRFDGERVSVSLSSMHASTMTEDLAREVRRVRKSGFTIAPEAGTQRLRDVINKNLDERQILDACRMAFEAGWDVIKLYFMIGLPTETDADVDGLVDLAHAILQLGRPVRRKSRSEVTLSVSSFVPKPHTPFQWLGMERVDRLHDKQNQIAARISSQPVTQMHVSYGPSPFFIETLNRPTQHAGSHLVGPDGQLLDTGFRNSHATNLLPVVKATRCDYNRFELNWQTCKGVV